MTDFKFTKEQEAWLKRLESDEDKQCTGRLWDGVGFCCLGLAAMVLGGKTIYHKGGVDSAENHKISGMTYILDSPYINSMHLRSHDGQIKMSALYEEDRLKIYKANDEVSSDIRMDIINEGMSLAYMNDRLKWPFKDIAAFIRRNPKAVFTNRSDDNE